MVTVCDVRRYSETHPNLTVVEGDFLHNSFPDTVFDLVVMVSTIEHIGFGSYGDPPVDSVTSVEGRWQSHSDDPLYGPGTHHERV